MLLLFYLLQAYEVSERELSRDATVILKVTYPDGYITTTPNAGTSREDTGSSEAIVVAVVVLAVFVLVAFLALGALIVYMKKRSDKPIYPAEMFEGRSVIYFLLVLDFTLFLLHLSCAFRRPGLSLDTYYPRN